MELRRVIRIGEGLTGIRAVRVDSVDIRKGRVTLFVVPEFESIRPERQVKLVKAGSECDID